MEVLNYMLALFVDTSSRVIISPYAISNIATKIFASHYNKTGFAYQAYLRNNCVFNANTLAVKDETDTYLLNYFNKDYYTYKNQVILTELALKDRMAKFQSLVYLDNSQWTII